MDFSFTEEQTLVAESVRAIARDVLLPQYARWDRNDEFPGEQWPKMGALGLLGMRVPAEYGGFDFDCVTAGIAMEETARGDFNVCYGMLNCCFVGDILGKFASEAVKRAWLPPMAAGKKVLCVCLTEPHCGSDAAAIRTRAVRKGDRWVLNGEKSAITLLMVGDAGIVFAKTDPDGGARGVSAFLVPQLAGHRPPSLFRHGGARHRARLDVPRRRRDPTRQPDRSRERRLLAGHANLRLHARADRIDVSRRRAGDRRRDHLLSRQRTVFGRPCQKNQGVTFPIAEWSARMEMGRWLCYRRFGCGIRACPTRRKRPCARWRSRSSAPPP